MSFKEVKITAVKWPEMSDEEQEIHSFLDQVKDREMVIPDRLYRMMMQELERMTLARKKVVLHTFPIPISFLDLSRQLVNIKLSELPIGTEAICIECISDPVIEADYDADFDEVEEFLTKESILAKYPTGIYIYDFNRLSCPSYNGGWAYEVKSNGKITAHLIRDGIDLTKGVDAKNVAPNPDKGSHKDDWVWEDQRGEWHDGIVTKQTTESHGSPEINIT